MGHSHCHRQEVSSSATLNHHRLPSSSLSPSLVVIIIDSFSRLQSNSSTCSCGGRNLIEHVEARTAWSTRIRSHCLRWLHVHVQHGSRLSLCQFLISCCRPLHQHTL